jgi:hypothetical protein
LGSKAACREAALPCANPRPTGDVADLDVWLEFEEASYGRQQLTWSKGLREIAGLAAQEATDEELAAEEVGADEDLVQLPPRPGAPSGRPRGNCSTSSSLRPGRC